MDSKHYAVQKRAIIIEVIFLAKIADSVQRKFKTDVHGKTLPSRLTIRHHVGKFSNSGHVGNAHKVNSCWPRSARAALNIEGMRYCMEASPKKLTRHLSQKTGVSKTSVRHIMQTDLQLFTYKIQILQVQTPEKRLKDYAFVKTTSVSFLKRTGFAGPNL